MTSFLLAFYEIDRAYGGPEEGGWWYDTGRLVRVFRVFKTEDMAYAAARRGNRLLVHLQRHNRPVNFVIYNGGRHAVEVHVDYAPATYPEERPRYE